MFALHSRRLRRRLSAPSSGSARRRARERLAAERTRQEGERLARLRRDQRLRDKIQQQRQLREELASYEPWGKAGGGAPNPGGVRFTDLRATGIYPEDELRGVSTHEACGRWSPPRRRRTPQRPVRLREDPQLCYAEALRQSVDNDIRYRQTPTQQQIYKRILDDMVDKRKKAIRDEIKRDLEYERKLQIMDGPWGKPGPGGTTWRNPRNIGLNFSKSMGWTDNEIFNKLKSEHRRYNSSSVALPRVKIDDNMKKEIFNEDKLRSANNDKLPQIRTFTNSAGNKYRKQNTIDGKNEADNASSKNGDNAKMKRSSLKGNFMKRLSNGGRVQRFIPEDDANNIVNSSVKEKILTPEDTILRLTGGVELVPLLARRRRVGARTLPSSDVTRPPDQSCQWRELLDMDYLRQLKQQMRIKCEQQEENRRESAESVRRHHATWGALWGRPGHGAPRRGRYARSNLARLLYAPPAAAHANHYAEADVR